jgi:hypothetical protein
VRCDALKYEMVRPGSNQESSPARPGLRSSQSKANELDKDIGRYVIIGAINDIETAPEALFRAKASYSVRLIITLSNFQLCNKRHTS